jgi:hypothetical protein
MLGSVDNYRPRSDDSTVNYKLKLLIVHLRVAPFNAPSYANLKIDSITPVLS